MFKRINFQSLPVKDQDRALAFYRDVLEMKVQMDAPYDDNWRWIFMEIPSSETLIHFCRSGEVSYHKVPALCLVTDEVDKECERMRGHGVVFADGPSDAPWHKGVRYAMFNDSENNLILIQSSIHEKG